MREILFRGKRFSDGEWVDGSLFVDERKDKHEILVGYVNYRVGWEVDPETVGQFTGMTDKHGKKIFEGDILKATASNPAGEDFEATVIVSFDDYELMWGIEHSHEIEVIGNIHDNPELLED